jgi:hypothetical protein
MTSDAERWYGVDCITCNSASCGGCRIVQGRSRVRMWRGGDPVDREGNARGWISG